MRTVTFLLSFLVFYLGFLWRGRGEEGSEKPEVDYSLNGKQPRQKGATDLSGVRYRYPEAASSALEAREGGNSALTWAVAILFCPGQRAGDLGRQNERVEIRAFSHETVPTSLMTITLAPGENDVQRAWELQPGPCHVGKLVWALHRTCVCGLPNCPK